MSRFARTQQEMRDNFPPVEVNQRWSAPDNDGNELRVIRILAKYPSEARDGEGKNTYWIVVDEYSKFHSSGSFDMRLVPEFNLRYVFRPKS